MGNSEKSSYYIYYDSFCNRYWNHVKREWVRYPGLNCTYTTRKEAEDDYSLYKSEDVALQSIEKWRLFMPLAA